jgi:hypothetical protein
MYCSKCGKEISADSVFCYSCGSKIEIKKEQDTIEDKTPVVIDKDKTSKMKDIKQTISEKKDESVILSTVQTPISQKKTKYSFGLLILLLFYGYSVSNWWKNNDTNISILTIIVIVLSFPLVIILYFQSRKILLKRKYFTDKVWLSSFISGFLSLIFVMSIIGFSTGIDGSIQRRNKSKEINEFSQSFIKQTKEYQEQELEYSKMMSSEPKTQSEINDKILKIDEYKNFLMKKDKNFVTLINFFRETNSKYKNDKSVDEQINKLEEINRDVQKTSLDSLDVYKKYLITGDEKYFNIVHQEYERQQPLKVDVTKLITSILKSL